MFSHAEESPLSSRYERTHRRIWAGRDDYSPSGGTTGTGADLRAAADESDSGGNNRVDILGQSHTDESTEANEESGGTHLEDGRRVGIEGLKEDMER